jgi:hypothetical protein
LKNPTSEQPIALANGNGLAADAPAALPCLYNHNCIEEKQSKRRRYHLLTPNQKRVKQKMALAVELMVRRHGIEKVGLLTLSFGVPGSGKGSFATWELRQQAKHWEFVQGRWHSFCTNVIAKRYADWICVFELHRDRVWHIHVVVSTRDDIRTGTDIATLSNYELPYWMRRGKHLRCEALAKEWRELRVICCRYRFGRVELLPVKKTAAAVGNYLGDYLVKTYEMMSGGKRCRLVRFSKGINQVISSKFTIHNLGQLLYRTRLKIVAGMLRLTDYGDFADYFGSRWNYYLKNTIAWVPIPFHFTREQFDSGYAAQLLAGYALNPKVFLEEKGKTKIDDVAREMLDRLREALAENPEARLKYQVQCLSDNFGDKPLTAADLQDDLFDSPDNPF